MNAKKITILNMSSDKNKGAFAILESSIGLLGKRTKDIAIVNADCTTRECKSMKWMNNLGYEHFGALIPMGLTNNPFFKSFKYGVRFLFSIYSLFIIYLLQAKIKRLIFLLPTNMRKPVIRIIRSDLIILKGDSYLLVMEVLKILGSYIEWSFLL